MKRIQYLLSLATILLFTAACNHDPDEITISSTTPEITAHSDVVVNNLTENETFTLAWTPAKYGMATDVQYDVYAKLANEKVLLGTTDQHYFSMTNGEVLEAVGANIIGNYAIAFSLDAVSAGGEKKQADDVTIQFKYDKVAYIWVPGNYQDNDPAKAPRLLQRTNGHFYGYVNLEGTGDVEFKFTSQPSWDGTNYGAADAENQLSTDGGAGNNQLAAGLYYFDVDLEGLTYTAVPLTRVGLIGGMNGWGTPDVEMTYNAGNKTWTAIAKVEKGQEYKVRFNDLWDVPVGSEAWNLSLGGSKDDLQVASGTNLQAANDGIFEFTLSLTDYPYTMKEVKLTENGLQLYVPSSNNSWNYKTAPMLKSEVDADGKSTGIYQGVLDFAADAEFVFAALRTPYGTQYGGAMDQLATYTDGATPVNLTLAAGRYFVEVDLNTAQVTTQNITAVALDCTDFAVELTYDSASQVWKGTHNFTEDAFYKIKVTTAAGASLYGGSNLDLQLSGDELYMKKGERTLELSLGTNAVNAMKIDGQLQDFLLYPKSVGVTGDFSDIGWNMAKSPQLPGDVKTGIYHGYVDMYGLTYGFKFTYGSTWMAGAATTDGSDGTKNFTLALDGENMSIGDGLYYWTVDLATNTASALPLTRVGVTGDFISWTGDAELARDATDGLYKVTVTLPASSNIKIRFNNGWDYNLGGDPNDLKHNSADNIAVATAGTYKLALDLAHTPYKLTMEKQ